MAQRRNQALVNFANGEWSPLMAARVDDPGYNQSLSWCQNFVPLPQGGIRKRPGAMLAALTNANSLAYLMPFQFSADDAIVVEMTNLSFRFYRNGGLILNTNVTITGISQANPGVVTAPGHGYINGQQVFISGVWGMPQINDRYYTVQGVTTNTFTLQDQFGNNVNTTAYGAYTSNGAVASVVTLTTPYQVADLPLLRYAQIGDIVYIVHPLYSPMKLVRSGFTNWTISAFSRTNDPFTGNTYAVTNITTATPSVVTVASTTGMNNGDKIWISGLHGPMSAFNDLDLIVAGLTGTTFETLDINGNPFNMGQVGNYTSGGTVNDVNNWPACVAFTSDGRLAYANDFKNPQGLWGSELPTGVTTNYDNFTTGTVATDGYAYQFAPVNGILDDVQEMKSFGGMIALLGASSIQQVYGAQTGTPPNPTAIGTLDTVQGAARVQPLAINQNLLFVDINQKKLRGLQFNFYYSAFETIDYNLQSQHFGEEAQFIKLAHMKGTPEIVWCLRFDGVLLSFTFSNFDPKDPLGYKGAWARHYFGGGAKVIDIVSIRAVNGDDQLYLTVQRTIGGVVYNTVEQLSNWPDIPLRRTFYTNSANQQTDEAAWERATWETLKGAAFLDMALTYDGTERGNQAQATITPSATSGTGITLTSSAAVFQPSDVGTQLWKFFTSTGAGGGQAYITGYISATEVTADVLYPFDTTAAIPAGSWAFAVENIVNAQLLAGQTVSVQADGGNHPSITVGANGLATLEYPVSKAQLGFSFASLAATQNLDFGTQLGTGGSKPRNVKKIRARFDESIGGMVGASEYDLETINARQWDTTIPGMPPPPFSGSVDMPLLDFWSESKKEAVIYHSDPTPLTLLGFDVELDTVESP